MGSKLAPDNTSQNNTNYPKAKNKHFHLGHSICEITHFQKEQLSFLLNNFVIKQNIQAHMSSSTSGLSNHTTDDPQDQEHKLQTYKSCLFKEGRP